MEAEKEVENPPLQFTLKVASRCNLDCSYCYVYHQLDDGWKRKPPLMSESVLRAALVRIRRYCEASRQTTVNILFHGGEPLLIGRARFRQWCALIDRILRPAVRPRVVVQTNATLVDRDWASLFQELGTNVGVSLDGPLALNDRHRIDFKGKGSYRRVVQGIDALHAASVSFAILAVAALGEDGAAVQRHLVGLQPNAIDYLFPDQTYASIQTVREVYGPTPAADFLIAAFDEWWYRGTMAIPVSPFTHLARAILGGRPSIDFIGNNPLGYVFVETDGAIEGLDVLRICGNGFAGTGLNVMTHDFHELAVHSPMHAQTIFHGLPLPRACSGCAEAETCAGGYLPHRYAQQGGFDNPSVWCPDLLALFAHLRQRLQVNHEETRLRRMALETPDLVPETSREACDEQHQ